MQSETTTVEDYITSVASERREAVQQIRTLCKEILEDHSESMAYGMPTYSREKKVKVAFGSQKKFITLYFLKPGIVQQFSHELTRHDVGKSCIRFKKPELVDFELVEKLLRATVQSEQPAFA